MIWQCNHKFDNNEKCKTPHLDEETIKTLFISVVNKLLSDKEEILENFELLKATVFDTADLENQQAELQGEIEVVAGMIQQAISENAHCILDQEEYQERYNRLVERFDLAKAQHTAVTGEIFDKKTRLGTLNDFLNTLRKQEELITEFDVELWCSLADYGTVYNKNDVRFTFKDGTEILA